MAPPYQLNPHRHLKIWLSDNPDVFMNWENQLRLIEMRRINPHDIIRLLFDSKLLSANASAELALYCEQYQIIPVDCQIHIFPHCVTDEERVLVSTYHDNIKNLTHGGNLAAAKDNLIWLRPVYKLGIISDFDTKIDTSNLPYMIEVTQPLLLNLGSVVVSGGIETLAVNNDLMVVVDEEDAMPFIKKTQQLMAKACRSFGAYLKDYSKKYKDALEEKFNIMTVMALQSVDPNVLLFKEHGNCHSALSARDTILRTTQDNTSYAQTIYSQISIVSFQVSDRIAKRVAAEHLRADAKAKNSWFYWLLLPSAVYNHYQKVSAIQDDEVLLTTCREHKKTHFLKFNVIYSTGPGLIGYSLFEFLYSKKEVDEFIAPFSFSHYGLTPAFFSANGLAFHTSSKDCLKYLELSNELGSVNDLSWLEIGAAAVKSREEGLRETMKKMPERLAQIHCELEQHIVRINKSLEGRFNFYQKGAKVAKVSALTETMSLFSSQGFNCRTFKNNLARYCTEEVNAASEQSTTKRLIQELLVLTTKAEFLNMVDEEGFIAVAQELSFNKMLGN
ncbi:MAG: hypothetical protein K2X39_02585 [Silvanigrellaceae bacterium]|nr:hypothetical protein [Silvanigrellaceae bacterium]